MNRSSHKMFSRNKRITRQPQLQPLVHDFPWGGYNGSTQQAAYLFWNVTIGGIQIDSNDWVGAFSPSTGNHVGAYQWDTSSCGGGVCSISVMGDDGHEDTIGYMLPDEIPIFEIYVASENAFYNATVAGNIMSSQGEPDDLTWIDGKAVFVDSLTGDGGGGGGSGQGTLCPKGMTHEECTKYQEANPQY